MTTTIPEGMEEVFDEFMVEAGEILERIDAEILELERAPASVELVASIFRSMHTIKGAAGFLEMVEVQAVAHHAENTLSAVRDGRAAVDQDLISGLLAAADRLRSLIAGSVEAPAEPAAGPTFAAGAAPFPAPAAAPAEPAELGSDSIRVDVAVLDQLLALSGELILNRNQLRAGLADTQGQLSAAVKSLTLLTSSLQQAVMKARMQPIRHAWGKFPRLVRDLSLELGKDVELELYGEETELDRGLLEPVKDALTHLLRNALDHGIEAPAERAAAGKPARGRLILAASHRSGFVTVEVVDDGAGIDVDAVRSAAVRKGLITAEHAESLGYDEVVELLFLPGFSTAKAVGNLSGRGVGLDVVKTEVERIGGSIRVASEPGEGTAVAIEIPLTLIGIPALIVTVAGQHFAITRSSVLQLATDDQVTVVAGRPAVRHDGMLLPVVDLAEALGMSADSASGPGGHIDIVCEVDGRRVAFRAADIAGIEEIVVKQLDPLAAASGMYAGVSILGSGVVTLIVDLPGLLERCGLPELPAGAQTPAAVQADAADAADRVLAVLCRRGERLLAFPADRIRRIEELAADTKVLGTHDVVEYRGGLLRILEPAGLPACDPDRAAESLVVLREPDDEGTPVSVRIDELIDIAELRLVGRGRTPLVASVASTADGLVEVLDLDAVRAGGPAPAPRRRKAVR